ncbi:MAG: 23S rRNA methyltransferase [Gammaproteobacteria bacterium RBG_16_51_14]|nr:MAG: 23S rRNA methyltransferase [Gammaproteobacteria bacterium RBG_16_51_14]
MTTIMLKPGKEKSLRRHHPWVFSGALAKVPGHVAIGETVELVTSNGDFMATGACSPHSQITVRVWSFDAGVAVNAAFFHSRLRQAIQRRKQFQADFSTTALRLVNAESDGLPGLVVDQYDTYLVIQCLTAGAEFWKQVIVDQLGQLLPGHGIYERSDVDIRTKEGLTPVKGLLSGRQPPATVEIREASLRFLVDIVNGHKTGFYLDQRENRKHIRDYANQADVLNCFAYSGGFGLSALIGGARHVTNVEISREAIRLLEANLAINNLDKSSVDNIQGDVFAILRGFRNEGRQFDLIILDPPRFADSRSQLQKALRGYKDINWLAFRLLRPGGILFTFSCSGLLEPALFQKVVADAALDAGRDAQIIQRLGQAMDHPVALCFPEGSYLKGLICRAD